MKKLYYKIELRIGEWVLYDDDENEYGELYYFNEGYMIFTDDSFEGYLTNDVVFGDIWENNELYLELLDFDEEEQLQFLSFSGHFEDIELPGAYTLIGLSEQEKFAAIKFVEPVKNSSKQEEIEKELERVKQIYFIP